MELAFIASPAIGGGGGEGPGLGSTTCWAPWGPVKLARVSPGAG